MNSIYQIRSKSEIFSSAHRMAKKYVSRDQISYRAAFTQALKKVYSSLRRDVAEYQLSQNGFNKWNDRLYYNGHDSGAVVYLQAGQWIAKGTGSKAAKAEAITRYNQIMGA